MKKLVFYSDMGIGTPAALNNELVELIGKENPKIGYISSNTDRSREWYNKKLANYKTVKINDLMYFDIDEEYDETKIDELFACDAIHLTGGNTFSYLNLLKQRKLIDPIKEYALSGGVLLGVSAGAMIMTNTIEISEIVDENEINLTDYGALGLVDFEFLPHWNEDSDISKVLEYSKRKNITVYLCGETDGVVVEGGEIGLIGNVITIKNGQIIKD